MNEFTGHADPGQAGGDNTGKENGPSAPSGAPGLPSQECHNCDKSPSRWRVTGSDSRTAFALQLNVARLVDVVGIERVGFLTLTTPDCLSFWNRDDWKEAQRRYHNFMRRLYPDLFGQGSRWLSVVEPQKRGGIHWHLVTETPGDIRTGVNFEEFRSIVGRGNYRSAGPLLRGLWKELRSRLPDYGLGRHELLPIRSSKEAVSDYVGKYIGKVIQQERVTRECDGLTRPSGARRVRYSYGSWRAAGSRFAWVKSGARWRRAVASMAAQLGIDSLDEWTRIYGPRWAFFLGESIMNAYDRLEGEQVVVK